MSQTDITLAVLAGGAGSRMGRPKGELAIAGQTILEYLLERLQWTGPTLLVTAPGREHPPGHRAFDTEVVDAVAGEGPLRGVLTALQNARSQITLIATVDMPGIGQEQLIWLCEMFAARDDLKLLMAGRLIDGSMKAEPFPSIYTAAAAAIVEQQLTKPDRSVKSLCHATGGAMVLAPMDWDERVWVNLNTLEDLKAFER